MDGIFGQINQEEMSSEKWPTDHTRADFANIIASLKTIGQKIISLSEHLSSDQLKEKPNGKWSIHEHVGHLLTIESLWIARLDDFVMKNETLRLSDPTNEATNTARFNEQRLGQLIEDLDGIRQAHLAMLSRFESECENMVVFDSEKNRPTRLIDHLGAMLDHDSIHIQAIQKRASQRD
jgi:uncharacterized damage-inducible protein DinB